ncbi:MAG: UbiA family prenyltransferase [Gemmatimonadaceae bacterium]|nr:UbiA family prenyltransferase [Gemmatimonadaceae bacterium]
MSAPLTVAADPTDWRRWVVYQRERFPVLAHGPLIGAFAFAAVSVSAAGRGARPSAAAVLVAAVSAMLAFFQLRVIDEHKDAADDATWRPYRPVPRGLVTLAELRVLGVAGAAVQLGTAWWFAPQLVWPLVALWGVLGLVAAEFGLARVLRGRAMAILLSHGVVVPCIDAYASMADWYVAGGVPAALLGSFLVASYANGLVVEIGRKLRAPSDEEPGVSTYTAEWGTRRALQRWVAAVAVSLASAVSVAWQLGTAGWTTLLLGGAACGVAWAVVRVSRGSLGAGRVAERAAGLWTLTLYGALGFLPWWRTP